MPREPTHDATLPTGTGLDHPDGPARGRVLGLILLVTIGTSWWLTAPLGRAVPVVTESSAGAATAANPVPAARSEFPPWPEHPLMGRPAKEILLKTLEAADRAFRRIASCTMTFRKQERINGKLLPEQTYFLKVRHDPFAIYMKCLKPVNGRELIYAEGQNDNQVIAHSTGLSRLLVPRLKIPTNHALIMAESRHPMNEAGLGNLIRKMIHYREMDLADPDSVTILDRTTSSDGKAWLRSTHLHPVYRPERPLGETEVLYDPRTRLPLRFIGYDRPGPGQTEKTLGERYSYDDLVLGADLSARTSIRPIPAMSSTGSELDTVRSVERRALPARNDYLVLAGEGAWVPAIVSNSPCLSRALPAVPGQSLGGADQSAAHP